MINIPLTKILFLDIETVGIQPDWDSLVKNNESLSFQFEHIQDNLRKLILIYRKFKIKNIVFLKIMRKLDIQVKNKLNKICTISIYNK